MTTDAFSAEPSAREAAAPAAVGEVVIVRMLLELIAIPGVTGSPAESEKTTPERSRESRGGAVEEVTGEGPDTSVAELDALTGPLPHSPPP
ncbi:hypothetical protein ACFS5L_41210 [Streptomyces phyllanthi]|uniref:Uncharacterized protein n=1 Tax=Streptomyces phyllanthi TaxID=1803180 RepID=A0A5N8WD69_9ACTN|nr:hypothetical protein [Streptomyces phyllanthi]MPY45082.1 hypothetical protein [Streptomyces phyllanthi]